MLIKNLESDIEYAQKIGCLVQFVKTQFKTFMIMNAGGLIFGIPAGVAVLCDDKAICYPHTKRKNQS